MLTSSTRTFVIRVLVPVALLTLAGYSARWSGLFRPAVLPYPHEILTAGFATLADGESVAAILVTLRRLAVVFVIASALGGGVALLAHQVRVLADIVALPVDLVRSVPIVALFPLFITLWGFSETTFLAVPVVLTSIIMYIHLMSGLRSVHPVQRRHMARWRASRLQTVRHLLLPSVAPHLFTAMRVCVSLQLILLLVAEMFLGARDGLGTLIYDYQTVLRYAEMYFFIAVAGLLGWGLNRCLEWTEHRLVYWRRGAT